MEDRILEVYEKEEDIIKIKDKLKDLSFDDLIKTGHFYYSLEEKATDINILKNNFNNFERIKLACKRIHKNGKISYDLYYELDNKTFLLYSLLFENRIILLNAYPVNRNFNHFKKSLLKSYKRQLGGY